MCVNISSYPVEKEFFAVSSIWYGFFEVLVLRGSSLVMFNALPVFFFYRADALTAFPQLGRGMLHTDTSHEIWLPGQNAYVPYGQTASQTKN